MATNLFSVVNTSAQDALQNWSLISALKSNILLVLLGIQQVRQHVLTAKLLVCIRLKCSIEFFRTRYATLLQSNTTT